MRNIRMEVCVLPGRELCRGFAREEGSCVSQIYQELWNYSSGIGGVPWLGMIVMRTIRKIGIGCLDSRWWADGPGERRHGHDWGIGTVIDSRR